MKSITYASLPKYPMKMLLLLACFNFSFASPSLLAGKNHDLSLSIPIAIMGTVGAEGALRVEYKFFEKVTVTGEWTSWGSKMPRQEMSNAYMKNNPYEALESSGRSMSLMFGKYEDTKRMAGYNWGLGVGYRTLTAKWNLLANDQPKLLADENETLEHRAIISGPTASSRVGYRYVAKSLGFFCGGYFEYKYFEGKVVDKYKNFESASMLTADKTGDLQGRLRNKMHLGVEIGWAF